jgi:hypothetical protein
MMEKPPKTHKCNKCGFEDRCWSWIGVDVKYCQCGGILKPIKPRMMKKKVVHKKAIFWKYWNYILCGRSRVGGYLETQKSFYWKHVTCKRCLAKKAVGGK